MYLRDPDDKSFEPTMAPAFTIFGHKIYDDSKSIQDGMKKGYLVMDTPRIQTPPPVEEHLDWDRSVRENMNLWQLARGEGSQASQESAILLIAYMSAVGLVSIYSNSLALGLGVVFAFIPYYHWTVTATTKPGAIRRAGCVLVDQGYEFTRIMYDNSLSQLHDASVEIKNVTGILADCLRETYKKTAISSEETYSLYKQILLSLVPEFEVVGGGSYTSIGQKFCGRKTVRLHTVKMVNKGVVLGGNTLSRKKACRKDRTEFHGIGVRAIGEFYRVGVGDRFAGTDRMTLLEKLVTGVGLQPRDVMTVLHDIALIRGRRYKMMGICFDGMVNNRERMKKLVNGFNLAGWAAGQEPIQIPSDKRVSPDWVGEFLERLESQPQSFATGLVNVDA